MIAADAENQRRALGAAANWHAVWALALGVCALAWPAGESLTLNYALAAAAAPGFVGQLLRWWRGGLAKTLVALAWPIGCGAATLISGGLAGPLAVLALVPAVAMATLDGRRFIALGAALTVATLAALALAHQAGAAAPFGPWLPLTVLAITVVALAAALQLAGARASARQQILEREAIRLQNLLDAGPSLLLRLDGAGVIQEVFSGAPEDHDLRLRGRRFEMLASEAHRDAARAALAIARRGGASSVGFAPPLAPDRFLAVELRGLPGGDFAAAVRDASRERAYEAWLEQGKADVEQTALAKSRFLANMSHELRTPLNAIIGFSEVTMREMFGPVTPRYQEYARLIHESGQHLLDLINSVLDMSKIEAGKFELSEELFQLEDVAQSAVRFLKIPAERAGVALRLDIAPQARLVFADRRAIKQILVNLLSNGVKYTPPGGEVRVSARVAHGIEIEVRDTGTGISKPDLERLGKPFEQVENAAVRAKEGTGLGLALVKSLAQMHGGEAVLQSALGEGTVVTVRLPYAAVNAKGERLTTAKVLPFRAA